LALNGAGIDVIKVSEPQNKGQFSTLILEDDRTSATLVAQAIRRNLPNSQVLTARTIAEARLLLEQYHFDFLILDLNLPDGSGIDFLHDLQVKCPEAGVAIVTGTALPEYRDQALAFGVIHFMEKPVDLNALLALVHKHYDLIFPPSDGGETVFFSGSLTSLTTLDIIQLKCLGSSTVVLDFFNRRRGVGRIFWQDGQIVHAKLGEKEGVDAFNEIVSWRGGQFVEVTDAEEPPHTITDHWQNLLLQAVQLSDERMDAEQRGASET